MLSMGGEGRQKPMRITFVGPFGLRPKMTMSRRALPLARALATRGHTVQVVMPPWDCPELSGLRWMDSGVEVINVPVRKAGSLLAPAVTGSALVRNVWRCHPDVLHCFKPKAYAGLVAGLFWGLRAAGLWSGRLFVDSDDWEGKGGWNELLGYSRPTKCLFAFQERWGVRHCDGVTAASIWLMDRMKGIRSDRAGLVHYLPNGVDCEKPDAMLPANDAGEIDDARLPSRSPTALLYTRFVEHKPEDVIAIWRRVVEVLPQARLLVAGQGLGGEVDELRVLAQRSRLSDSMDIRGWWQDDQLAELFAGVDMVLMPVRDGLVSRAKSPARLLDVLAAGLPVVAHAVGEWVEMLEDGACGVLVRPGDDAGFAAEVVRMLEDPRLRRRIGESARLRAHSLYDWHRLAVMLESAYYAAGAVDRSSVM